MESVTFARSSYQKGCLELGFTLNCSIVPLIAAFVEIFRLFLS